MLSRNAPLLDVEQQGGWRSASVLLRVYARWMPQDLAPSVTPVVPEARRVAEARGQCERQVRALAQHAEHLLLDTEHRVVLAAVDMKVSSPRYVRTIRVAYQG